MKQLGRLLSLSLLGSHGFGGIFFVCAFCVEKPLNQDFRHEMKWINCGVGGGGSVRIIDR